MIKQANRVKTAWIGLYRLTCFLTTFEECSGRLIMDAEFFLAF